MSTIVSRVEYLVVFHYTDNLRPTTVTNTLAFTS